MAKFSMASTSLLLFSSMAASSLYFPATVRIDSAGILPSRCRRPSKHQRMMLVRSDLEKNVSDMSTNAPKGLFPPEPEHYRGPKLKVAIIGAGLAGMSTAVELLDQGHKVDIYESRPFIGGKVGSFTDRRGNHIEMGLHVFFGCYNNLFRLMKKVIAAAATTWPLVQRLYRLFKECPHPDEKQRLELSRRISLSSNEAGWKSTFSCPVK